MKIVAIFTIIASLGILGCSSSTSPTAPAQAPASGSLFTFHGNGVANGMPISWDVSYTMHQTSDGFKAIDSSGAEVVYKLYDNGDIGWACCCDWLELGVASQRGFRTKATSTPAKLGGREYTAWTHFESKYLGQEEISGAGKVYDCAKIEVDGIMQEEDTLQTSHRESVNTYWYSPELRYFTRIDSKTYYLDSLVSSARMTLVSVK